MKIGDTVWITDELKGEPVDMAYRIAKIEDGKLLAYSRYGVTRPEWVWTIKELYEADARLKPDKNLRQIGPGEDAPVEGLTAVISHTSWNLIDPESLVIKELREQAAKLGFKLVKN